MTDAVDRLSELLRDEIARATTRARAMATTSLVAGLPVLDGYRWELAIKRSELRIGLWHGPRHMGWIKWAWRSNSWQPIRLSNAACLPTYDKQVVLWSGTLIECAWALLAACETGWSHNVEDHREKLADFISANGGAQ